MSEGGAGPPPQVFVVDSQANYIPMPSGKKPSWIKEGQKFLLLLLGLAVLGVIVEGYLLYKVYLRTEELSLCLSHPPCHNSSSPSAQQGGTISTRVGSKESKESPVGSTNELQRPFAHLTASQNHSGTNGVVQWEEVGEARTNKMKYGNGTLTIEQNGFYYVYSKVEFNAAKECEAIFHSIVKKTGGYDKPIPLMSSKNNRCWSSKVPKVERSNEEDLRNSFLGGVFHLVEGDKIFVTLTKIEKLYAGHLDNFMGAFMISQ